MKCKGSRKEIDSKEKNECRTTYIEIFLFFDTDLYYFDFSRYKY